MAESCGKSINNIGKSTLRLCIVLPDMSGGGAERAALTLASSFIEKGYDVKVGLLKFRGEYRDQIPDKLTISYWRTDGGDRGLLKHCHDRGIKLNRIRVNPLSSVREWAALRRSYPGLRLTVSQIRAASGVAKLVRTSNPDLVFSLLNTANAAAVMGIELAESNVPVVASVRNNLEVEIGSDKHELDIARTLLSRANAVVAVSQGVADSTAKLLALNARKVRTIYNPVPVDRIRRQAKCTVDHPWFGENEPPVILSYLRMGPQKDWKTLILAFGEVRRALRVRLAILIPRLKKEFARELFGFAEKEGVRDSVCFLEFQENPFKYMSRSRLFVLSSRYEGMPMVLLESLACGTPVVSTDAPFGPAEILEHGQWGRLVPVGAPNALAQAMIESMSVGSVDRKALVRRASCFSLKRSVNAYESLFHEVIEGGFGC